MGHMSVQKLYSFCLPLVPYLTYDMKSVLIIFIIIVRNVRFTSKPFPCVKPGLVAHDTCDETSRATNRGLELLSKRNLDINGEACGNAPFIIGRLKY